MMRILFCSILAAVSAAPMLAHADGLGDFKQALTRLQGQTPVKASFEVKSWNRSGEGKDLEEKNGSANVLVVEGADGLQINYGRDMLSRLDAEQKAKQKDPKAKTPTLMVVNELGTSNIRSMTTAAASLSRTLEKAEFKSEHTENWNGKPARVLNFVMNVDKLTEKDRKFVKDYEKSIDVWIAADGTPLASREHEKVSGRAYVVISFEMTNDSDIVYSQVGDRLVAIRKESKNSGSGMGEKSEGKTVSSLQVQS